MSEKWTKADILASSYQRGAAVLQEVLTVNIPWLQYLYRVALLSMLINILCFKTYNTYDINTFLLGLKLTYGVSFTLLLSSNQNSP